MKYISDSIQETQKIATDFIKSIAPKNDKATVVGLYGNLGAGKTAFVKCVANALGVAENITSPTFVIEKIYELRDSKFTHLIHIDAYRLKDSNELLKLGWEEIISDKNNLILIEWPEIVDSAMPEHIKIRLKTLENESSRDIEIVV
jgi:tRNA threonylcarbamoyladenosine biosynthesis protein TsaE